MNLHLKNISSTFTFFRGHLARCIITAQQASPTFTHVYAALVAVINSRVSIESVERGMSLKLQPFSY